MFRSRYELFWLNNGLEGGAKRANSKIAKFKKSDVDEASHWFHGVLYQVKNHNDVEPLGGGAQLDVIGPNRIKGRVDLELGERGDHTQWMQFDDAQGNTQGSVSVAESGGVNFETTSGDFAEYFQRDPTEAPFEEGDLVGFGAGGLTRKTKKMRQLGVITRMAAVSGSVSE